MNTLTHDGGLRLLIVLAVTLLGAALAQKRSTYLVDLFLIVACSNRLLRRVLDWLDDRYDPQPLLSLVAPALAGLMVCVILGRARKLPARRRRDGAWIAIALAWAMLFGVTNGFGAFYALLGYLMPVATLFYPMVVGATRSDIVRWIRLLVALGVGVAAYGIFQWAVLPPWDSSWLLWSGMTSSMGRPEPFRISAWSTLESRGPCALFCAIVASLMCFSTTWRRPWGIPGAALVVLLAVLTRARSSWGFLTLAVALFASQRKGARTQTATAAIVLAAAMVVVLPRLPGGDAFASRAASLTDIASDGSFRGRIAIAQGGFFAVLRRPQGYGLGSTGVAADRTSSGAVLGDNGYLGLLVDLGIPGFLLAATSLYRIGIDIRKNREATSDRICIAALALGGAGMAMLAINNCVPGPYGAIVFLLLGSSLCIKPADETRPYRAPDGTPGTPLLA